MNNISWKKAESNERPLLVSETGSGKLFVRKNIVETQKKDSNGNTHIFFEYDEAIMGAGDYATYVNEEVMAKLDYLAMMTEVDIYE